MDRDLGSVRRKSRADYRRLACSISSRFLSYHGGGLDHSFKTARSMDADQLGSQRSPARLKELY